MPSAGANAGSLFGQSDSQAGQTFGQAQGEGSALSGIYNQDITNPQGFGATTLAQMLTQSGESTAGGIGAAKQTAMDLGARTGNTAAIPGIIGAASKAGIEQQGNAANSLAIQNQMEKMKQQQFGAQGLSQMYGENLGAAQGFEKNANEAVQSQQAAENNSFFGSQGMFGKLAGAAIGGVTGGAGFLQNLLPQPTQQIGGQLFSQLGGGQGNSGAGVPVSLAPTPDQIGY